MIGNTHNNREAYLEAAIQELTGYIEGTGYPMPTVKVSCGWPSARAFSAKNRCLGQTWHKDMVQQETSHIFISPYLSDTGKVLAVLVHELGHAILEKGDKHKRPFKQYMKAVDLKGKATATEAGDVLQSFINLTIEKIGEYPHSSIDKLPGQKKQTTRLRLWVCPGCATKVRAASDNLRVQCLDCELGFIKDGDCKGEGE